MKKVFVLFIGFLSLSLWAAGFTWPGVLAHKIHLPEFVVTFALVGIVLMIVGLLYRIKISETPNIVIPDRGITLRNIVEMYGNFIYQQCQAIIGEKAAPRHFPFIATVFIFILVCNLIGLIPGFLPPTEYLNTTLALGALSFIYYNIQGCRVQGTLNYIKHFCGPLWYLAVLVFPIEIVSNFIRPFSLALRLRFNMMGDHIVLSEFSKLVPLIVPIAFMFLGILVSLIQAYVFTVLTMVYIQMAVEEHHDHDAETAH